ncbi:hypothetical protein AB0L42_42270 [Streptomyces sp. NPDC052287]|uniref:hypothetical protein n=1 Tax=Streptomyces sp. NPDC052287 TaxID=3154950 RepID=UPI0034379CDD
MDKRTTANPRHNFISNTHPAPVGSAGTGWARATETGQSTPPAEAVIKAKAEGRRPPEPRTGDGEQGGQVLDLMAALQESVRKAQPARGEDSGNAEIHEMPESKPEPKKKAAATKTAKKAPAKKAAEKTAAAKKPARRRGA